ncbi:hypothetical protein BJX66DRAFT_9394 [Aspergillus keveii]|uniref:Secreted protein n=1 Tax=Aspergillus keveii TaxID=714993 RepID=A0ABR4GQK1_9EURO
MAAKTESLRSLFVIPLSWLPPLAWSSEALELRSDLPQRLVNNDRSGPRKKNMQSLSPGALGARLSFPMSLLLFESCKITLFHPSWKRTPFPDISRALKFRLIFHPGPLVRRESVWHGNVRRHLSHIFVLSGPVERRASCLWPCLARHFGLC